MVDLVRIIRRCSSRRFATARGTLICCNNVAQMDREAWVDQLEQRQKAGRPIRREIIARKPTSPAPTTSRR